MAVTDVITYLINMDYAVLCKRIERFISSNVDNAGAKGVVLGLSGGIDSATTAYLAARALPRDKVLGLILPDYRTTPKADIVDAKNIVKNLGIKSKSIDITTVHNAFMNHLNQDKIASGNLRARIRMCFLYYYGNLENKLVLGTGDRSEVLIGYFTKYGDGSADILPIGGLYKTQIRELGRYLGVPTQIVKKESSPHLWEKHTAKEELNFPYETIDSVLHLLFDRKKSLEETCNILGDNEVVRIILEMNRLSNHKRITPKICRLPQPQNSD